ncbi:Riboflavin transporter [Ascidiaceihabitans donghaensis]|uniref:Riboflavin transporter n=1 Tax=Ascidiaceihabitans donghaensis TaxID=1510460 RepID=A0A2R8BF20_9RHOB|nr:DMT family transporter [Ascidiaceihabitans donghaensis]SPH21596.1 Riboflavin transporter [Ascidiaceihabitans donghaensis]
MDNLRGAGIMVLAMLGFAIEDMFIKLLAGSLPIGQIIGLMATGGAIIYAIICRQMGLAIVSRDMLTAPVLIRNFGELFGTVGFVTAIALTPISTASAILQATPLVVTLGAAVFLGEKVGWRRWSAILVGFVGVMLIIRPGMEGFDYLSLFTLQGVLGLAIRDIATRRIPKSMSSMQLSFLAFVVLIPAALILQSVNDTWWVAPSPTGWLLVGCSIVIGVIAYYGIVAAMRVGEVSFVTPFRYSRLLFALVVGFFVFQERPDALTLLGSVIIVASGIYTVWRERRVKTTL